MAKTKLIVSPFPSSRGICHHFLIRFYAMARYTPSRLLLSLLHGGEWGDGWKVKKTTDPNHGRSRSVFRDSGYMLLDRRDLPSISG